MTATDRFARLAIQVFARTPASSKHIGAARPTF